jgi:hypothetical protein
MTEYQVLLNFNINHKKINPMSNARNKGKARPSTPMTQELVGLTYGARQESKYKTAVMILSTTSAFLVMILRRDGIDAS